MASSAPGQPSPFQRVRAAAPQCPNPAFYHNREARVMDAIAQHLQPVAKRITIPRSVPGLVMPRLLVRVCSGHG